ncbi:MAG TPA: hypothetical protein H9774_12115 [Candidatus Desulfovibrio gallistercoris]|nr:hypothetical protein [Candidatus Desulfovibrio gallistercoris]
MKEAFKKYLIDRGYKYVTPSGNPSTVDDYCNRVDRITAEENLTWQELAERIDDILPYYDKGGRKQYIGEKSHRSFINALKRFSEFVKSL